MCSTGLYSGNTQHSDPDYGEETWAGICHETLKWSQTFTAISQRTPGGKKQTDLSDYRLNIAPRSKIGTISLFDTSSSFKSS